MKLNKIAAATILASLGFTSLNAQALTVDGITWDPNSIIDFFATSNLFETTTGTAGQTISGYGQITSINGLNNFATPGTELTYEFGGFVLSAATSVSAYGSGINSDGSFGFTGGWLKVYSDTSTAYNFMTKSTATDGVLWLDLLASSAVNSPFTLIGTITGSNDVGLTGQGSGHFDSIGGSTGAYFDTNTQPGLSDFRYTSSFQALASPIINGGITVATAGGTNEIRGASAQIPEPTSIALLGLGLLGLGFSRRNKKAA